LPGQVVENAAAVVVEQRVGDFHAGGAAEREHFWLDGLCNLLVDGYNDLESALRVLRRAPGDSPRARLIRSHLLEALVALDVAFFDYSRTDGTPRFSLSLASDSARRRKCYFEGVVAGLDGAGA
jgi:hypothetical protein